MEKDLILPGDGEVELHTWLYALAARVREIIVMNSRLVIFSFCFKHKCPIEIS